MTREVKERRLGKQTEHAIRTAALRLALDRAAQDVDPAEAYGCVDWFPYAASAPSCNEDAPRWFPSTPGHGGGRDGPPSAH